MAFKKTKSIKPQPITEPESVDSGHVMVVTEPKQHPNGHCPKCGTPAPNKGTLLGPPWKVQLQTARLHISQHHGVKPEDVSDNDMMDYLLALHGGYLTDCPECGTGYLVRVKEWPAIKAIHIQPPVQVVDNQQA